MAREGLTLEEFVFAISLKPRSASVDWGAAELNLRRSVRSAPDLVEYQPHSRERRVGACGPRLPA
jgi:hypothetical protein